MAEINHEINQVHDDIINRAVFDTGKHFCEQLVELEFGGHYIESHVLPLRERALFDGDDSIPVAEKPHAENKTVVVTGKNGNKVSVADLFRVDDEIVSGESREYTLTPEGWIVPKGLIADEGKGFSADMTDLVRGYFSHLVEMSDGEAQEEAETAGMAMMTRKARKAIKMVPLKYFKYEDDEDDGLPRAA